MPSPLSYPATVSAGHLQSFVLKLGVVADRLHDLTDRIDDNIKPVNDDEMPTLSAMISIADDGHCSLREFVGPKRFRCGR